VTMRLRAIKDILAIDHHFTLYSLADSVSAVLLAPSTKFAALAPLVEPTQAR
jgi:hypothetical protein